MDIFKQIVSDEKLCHEFKVLRDEKVFGPAYNLISKITTDYKDNDGNFVEQFQSSGFYPRLWELFLHELFKEERISILKKHKSPDFHLKSSDGEFFVEASCSNPAVNDIYSNEIITRSIQTLDKKVEKDIKDYYTIKIGSVLYSKLRKEYWNLSWVRNKPLIFSILPSHNSLARLLPDYNIAEYLYGISYKPQINEQDDITFLKSSTKSHTHYSKEIPSNFFSQPNTEYISGVLFTNTCDTQKFNRMAHQGEFYDDNLILFRCGKCFDLDSPRPKDFNLTVRKDDHVETWAEGVTLFHNPNAKFPISPKNFKSIRQVWINPDGEYGGTSPKFYPYMSIGVSMYYA